MKGKTVNLLGNKIGEYLHNFKVKKVFLRPKQNKRKKKEKLIIKKELELHWVKNWVY